MDLVLQTALRRAQQAGLSLVTPEGISQLRPDQIRVLLTALPEDVLDRVFLAAASEQRRRRSEAQYCACTHPRHMHASPSLGCPVPDCGCREVWPHESPDWGMPF
jgi:hypothetical protein